MKIKKGTFLYALLRPWVRIGALLFFRRITIIGDRKFSTSAPVILIANHQNAMLDPVLCCVFLRRQLHWLTRADVFENALARKFLFNLNMMPVYRERDQIGDLRSKNEDTFEVCYKRMQLNAAIAMFPEGTHRGKKHLHPFKKGLARIAFSAVRDYGVSNLCIQPVGLDYTDYYKPGGDLTMIIGAPRRVQDFLPENPADDAKAAHGFLQAMRQDLSKLMIHIESEPYDDMLHHLAIHYRAALSQANISRKHYLKAFIDRASDLKHNPLHVNELKVRYARVSELSRELKLEADSDLLYPTPIIRLMIIPLCGVAFLPFFFTCIAFLPLQWLIERFIQKVIKDPLFPNSIRLAAWTFLAPLWIVLIAFGVSMISHSVTFLATAVWMLVSLIIAARLRFVWRDWRRSIHWASVKRKFPDLSKEWKRETDELRKALIQV